MDFERSKLAAEFIFRNPNIKSTCGCGESFSMDTPIISTTGEHANPSNNEIKNENFINPQS